MNFTLTYFVFSTSLPGGQLKAILPGKIASADPAGSSNACQIGMGGFVEEGEEEREREEWTKILGEGKDGENERWKDGGYGKVGAWGGISERARE